VGVTEEQSRTEGVGLTPPSPQDAMRTVPKSSVTEEIRSTWGELHAGERGRKVSKIRSHNVF
jgi:hypothetical protein